MRSGLIWAVVAWLVLAPARAGAQQPTFRPAPPATTPAPGVTDPTTTSAPPTPTPGDPSLAPDERAAAVSPATPSPALEPELPPPAPPAPPVQPAPPPSPPEWQQLPRLPPRHRLYGDAGTMELALALGYTRQTGFVGGGGFRRFVIDGVGPGLEASVQKSDTQTTGLLLATLKLVPFRGDAAALVLTGRGGRVLLSDHDDGWGAGVGAGVVLFVSAGVGLELGYSILWLMPSRFCADLVSCSIAGPELGLRVMF